MSRPKRIRKVTNLPHFKGFKPIGIPKEITPVILNYEEYEAIRLSDYELYRHDQAAKIMEVSRPTYSRIYESARKKVGMAFVSGKTILFEGGKVFFDTDWYKCESCGCYFNHTAKEKKLHNCSLCGSTEIERNHTISDLNIINEICICQNCGFEKEIPSDIPSRNRICSNCNQFMVRKEDSLEFQKSNKN